MGIWLRQRALPGDGFIGIAEGAKPAVIADWPLLAYSTA